MRRRFQPHHVSIHAPAWGTTLRQTSGQRLDSCFNPRTRVGCDLTCGYRHDGGRRFQSTHPRGVRLIRRYFPSSIREFQSTHPRGVRRSGKSSRDVFPQVSIHAPAWGATAFEKAYYPMDITVSIHAPAWGATSFQTKGSAQSRVSIHAPAWGATGGITHWRQACNEFQSTHPRGVRLPESRLVWAVQEVSIHAPAWGARIETVISMG